MKEMSDMMREQRKLMEEDEQTKLVMQALPINVEWLSPLRVISQQQLPIFKQLH